MARSRTETNHSTSRTLAAVAGTLPLSLAVGAALALILPLPLIYRLITGGYSVFPVWVATSIWVFLSPSGAAAWRRVGIATAVAVALAVVGSALRGVPGVAP